MKQLMDHHQSLLGRVSKLSLTTPAKSLTLVLLAALPLIASASTAGILDTEALLPDAPVSGVFDWPSFSMLAAGVIALVYARASATTKNIE